MNYLDQVQRGIDYIEQRLDQSLSPAAVAQAAGISQWHFQRIFKALTKETLKTYIRCRRMSNTLHQLIDSDMRILEIALAAGYETQESFTRAFKQMFGMTPLTCRKQGANTLFLRKIQLRRDYLVHINDNLTTEPEIVTLDAMTFIGLNTRYYGPESEKNNLGDKLKDLWRLFLDRLSEISEAVPGTGYGIIHQTPEQPELLDYCAAFAIHKPMHPPPGMVEVALPKTTYARFIHTGKPELLNHSVNYIYSNWLLRQSKYRHSYAADIEIYGPGYIPNADQSVIHYAIPIQAA